VEGDGHLAGNDQSDDVAYRDDHATDHPVPLTKVMASSEIAYPARPVIAFPCPVKSPRKSSLSSSGDNSDIPILQKNPPA
jgi:hypothetical protein